MVTGFKISDFYFSYFDHLYLLPRKDFKSVFKKSDIVVGFLFYVHGKQLWSCRDGQLT